MKGGRLLAAFLLLSVIARGLAAGLPYATVDGKCIDETTLAAAINAGSLPADAKTKAVDGCKQACDRWVLHMGDAFVSASFPCFRIRICMRRYQQSSISFSGGTV